MLLDNPYNRDWRVENEVNFLLENGYKVRMICTKGDKEKKKETIGNLTIERLITNNLFRPLSSEYKRNEKEIVNYILSLKPKIIHCHDFRMLNIGALVKEKSKKTKFIFDSHEYLPGYHYYKRIPELKNRIKGKFIWLFYLYKHNKAIKLVDDVISVSPQICEKFEVKFQKNVYLVRNMPNKIKITERNNNYFNKKFNINIKNKIIIHTGNTHFTLKRFITLSELINSYKDISLVFLGSQKSIIPFNEYVQNNKLKNIYFHENVPRDEITHYCSQADIGLVYFWNPEWESYDFASPNKLFDTSLSGLPVISTNQTALKNFADDHGHMTLFNGNSTSELKIAFDMMIDNFMHFKEKANKVREKVNWSIESEELKKLYNKYSN